MPIQQYDLISTAIFIKQSKIIKEPINDKDKNKFYALNVQIYWILID